MDSIKEFIENPDALITRAELARRMFPKVKGANQYLQAKISGTQGRKLNETDLSNARAILHDLAKGLLQL